jgi:hypothetical protein
MNSLDHTYPQRTLHHPGWHWLFAALSISILFNGPAVGAPTPAGEGPVYRCPGPPVRYTAEITPDQAKERNCRSIEGTPIAIESISRPLTTAQTKFCISYADAGFVMATRKAKGWTKQEQIAHYRKQYGDTDAMQNVNDTLLFLYSDARQGLNARESREAVFQACKSKLESSN